MSILERFPLSSEPYTHQKNVLLTLEEALRSGDEGSNKFLILRAPTGTGKSAVAITLAQEVRARGGSVHLLASHKFLQTQYHTDFSSLGLKLLWGKGNYDCNNALELNKFFKQGRLISCAQCLADKAEDRTSYIRENCTDSEYFGDKCLYIRAKEEAKLSSLTLNNYNSFLAHTAYAGTFAGRDLLIVDEAHLLSQRLADFITTKFTVSNYFTQSTLDSIPTSSNAADFTPWLEDFLLADVEDEFLDWAIEVNPSYNDIEAAEIGAKELEDSDSLISGNLGYEPHRTDVPPLRFVKLNRLRSRIHKLINMLTTSPDNWVCYKIYKDDRETKLDYLEFKPVVVGKLAHKYLFDYGALVLLLSATMDSGPFLRDLGISANEVRVFLDVPSVFPLEARPLLADFCGKMSANHREKTLPKVAEKAASIIKTYHPTEKGIIHTHSFKNCRDLKKLLPKDIQDRIIWHLDGTTNINDLTQTFFNSATKWLASPSCTEGLDGKGDRVRAQIIIKAPFPSLGDPQVIARKNKQDGYTWYCLAAVNKIVQAYGRGTRNKEDYSVTYVLDSAVANLVTKTRKHLPEWFTTAWNKASLSNWDWDGSRWRLR